MVMMGSLLYAYEFFIRVAPSSLNLEMMHYYSMSDSDLGHFKAAFYFGYVCMQIPAGLLIDRFGPRRLLFLGMLICSLSTFAVAFFQQIHWLVLARIFAGMASSFAYLCPLVLIHHWLPHRFFGYAAGMVQLIGNLAAMLGTVPVLALFQHYGMQGVFITTGVIGICGSAIMLLVKPQGPIGKDHHTLANIPQQLKVIHRTPNTYVLATLGLISWIPMAIIAENYGNDYFQALWQLDATSAQSFIMTIWIGNCIGGPLMGWGSQKINRRFTPMILSFGISAACLLGCTFMSGISGITNFILCLGIGICSGVQVVTFATLSDRHAPSTMGTASGVQNMAVAASGLLTLTMPTILAFLRQSSASSHQLFQGLSHHHLTYILGLLIGIMLLGILIAALLGKETYCQQQERL